MRKSTLFVLCLSVLGVSAVHAEGSWSPLSEKEGIELFYRDVDGFRYGEYKSVITLDASIDSVFSIFYNFSTYKEWYGFCSESATVDTVSPYRKTIFMLFSPPFPYPSKYSLVDVTFDDGEWNSLTDISFVLSRNNYGIEVEDSEYLESMYGVCELKQLDQGTRVTFVVKLDPGGNAPNVFVKKFLTRQLYLTGIGLRSFSARMN